MKFDVFTNIKNRIPRYSWGCLLTGLLVGWITHFYMLTNKFTNWDDINNMDVYGSGDYLGRWMLKYIHPLGSIYSIPAVHGMLFVLCLAIAACFVLEILHLKSTTAAVLVPALMVTFPSVACTMTFMFMAHTSGIAILAICVAVYLLRRYKWGWIPCSLLLLGSLGVYQSYISIAIALMLMGMLADLLDGKEAKLVFQQGVLCVVVLLVTVIIYMWLCHVIYPNIDNETYGGIGNMGNIAISEMPILIARCYKRFLEYFIWKPFAFISKTMQFFNICTCVLAGVLGVYLIFAKKMYKNIQQLVLFCLVSFFMPLATAFVYFMAPEVDYSLLMLYAYVMIYVIVVALWEKAMVLWNENHFIIGKLPAQLVSMVMVVVISMSCYCNYLVTNKAYLRMDIALERVQSYFNRIIVAVEETEGYQNRDKVTILGEFNYQTNPSIVELDVMDTESLREMSGVSLENGLITTGVRDNFIRYFLGFPVEYLDWNQKVALMESEEFQNMPSYPTEGSIQQINGIWVVKLCDYEVE